MKNYKIAIENLSSMYKIYEELYGSNSEKSAKICMELGQIYELSDNLSDAVEYYRNSLTIWENIIKDGNYEVLFSLSIKLSELYEKSENFEDAYHILKKVKNNYNFPPHFILD
jgi:tetratricopeptide (TPR) repeat protein